MLSSLDEFTTHSHARQNIFFWNASSSYLLFCFTTSSAHIYFSLWNTRLVDSTLFLWCLNWVGNVNIIQDLASI